MQNTQDKPRRTYRRHDNELKRHLVALCSEPGASVAAIAREHGINANMLFTWRKQQRVDGSSDAAMFLPVQISAEQAPSDVAASRHASKDHGMQDGVIGTVEIHVAGACVRLVDAVDEANLCSVLRALRQSA